MSTAEPGRDAVGPAGRSSRTPPARVILVRPWRDVHRSGGCCGGGDGTSVALEPDPRSCPRPAGHDHDDPQDRLRQVYTALRRTLPAADVQIVSAGNTAYLLPATFRARRPQDGWWAAARTALRATTPGAVLVDGRRVADLAGMTPDAVVRSVQEVLADR